MGIREIEGAGFRMMVTSPMEEYRAETFWTKEPETIEWIKSFVPGFVFYDIGANIGVYSLFAGVMPGCISVVAFEPEKMNYIRLRENIELNRIRAVALPIALGLKQNYLRFYVRNKGYGGSGSQVGKPVDEEGRKYTADESYEVVVASLDELLMRAITVPPPNYIKIDVDGQERMIIEGMKDTLSSEIVMSVLVEINGDTAKAAIFEIMDDAGFTADNRFNTMSPHSRDRRKREGIKAENWVFTR